MISLLCIITKLLWRINTPVLRLGAHLAWVALALMVGIILVQIFYRYGLNNALAWPPEAARFLMLWMMGLIAPMAYRQGGFVAIDSLQDFLPTRLISALACLLLSLSGVVLSVGVWYGWNHTMGFGGNFDSSSLWLPLNWIGLDSIRIKLRFMYASLLVCMILLSLVNIELLLRNFLHLIRPDLPLPAIKQASAFAESAS